MALRIIFITGTDTGVGKTVLTSLLLSHLRQTGHRALALKPFCSGSTAGLTDADILYELQDHELAPHEINPFFFPEPLAPLVAARRHRSKITLDHVVSHIRSVITTHLSSIKNPKSKIQNGPCLLIEGAGGLLTPLGEGFNLLDIITSFPNAEHNALGTNPSINNPKPKIQNLKSQTQTVIASSNRLGTINHTLLTAQALRNAVQRSLEVTDYSLRITTVLMQPSHPDASSSSNRKVLTELLRPIPVFTLPHLGRTPLRETQINLLAKKHKLALTSIFGFA